MSNYNKMRGQQLGMSLGAARNRLHKNILFTLLVRLKSNYCYQCGKVIASVDTLSIEHKTPWLHSDNPTELYFDIKNIAFSHLSCNVAASRKPHKKYETVEEQKRAGFKRYWDSLGKVDQQKLRRDKYIKYGC